MPCILCEQLLVASANPAAFWINCRGLIELAEDLPREHCNSPAWTEQELEHGVVKHVLKERA